MSDNPEVIVLITVVIPTSQLDEWVQHDLVRRGAGNCTYSLTEEGEAFLNGACE